MNDNQRKQCQKIRYKDKISAMFALSQCRRKIGKVTEKIDIEENLKHLLSSRFS